MDDGEFKCGRIYFDNGPSEGQLKVTAKYVNIEKNRHNKILNDHQSKVCDIGNWYKKECVPLFTENY